MDPPVDLTVYDDQIVVRGQYHVLAFDHAQKSSPWSIQFEPPGANNLALIAAGAVTTVAALGSAAQGRYCSGSDNQTQRAYLANANRLTGTYQAMAAERFAASEKSLDIAFFLTKDESIQLVGIDLTTGKVVGTILMPGKQPLFTVDAVTDTVFYFGGGDNSILEAHSF
jgi:hypothetical protein